MLRRLGGRRRRGPDDAGGLNLSQISRPPTFQSLKVHFSGLIRHYSGLECSAMATHARSVPVSRIPSAHTSSAPTVERPRRETSWACGLPFHFMNPSGPM